MNGTRPVFSRGVLIFLFSMFLIGAGFSRSIETDFGNILIHDIEVESFEGFFYGARLFRPIQASSMNQRPAILIIPGDAGNRYTGDHIAMEFARRGFVVLTIEDFSQGATPPQPSFETENLIDAGYNFLSTRTFTDHNRTGLIALYSGAGKSIQANYFEEFSSVIFVSPDFSRVADSFPPANIYTAQYESDPDYRIEQKSSGLPVKTYSTTHRGMILDKKVISAMLEEFHEELAIPNDSPFWFDSTSQRSQLLVFLRCTCLILLMIFSIGISTQITNGQGKPIQKYTARIIIPAAVFILVSEFMNFFLISVQLGSPFNYLTPINQQITNFSLFKWFQILLFCLVCTLPAVYSKKVMVSDIFAMIGIILCLTGFLPILFGAKSGWEILGITKFRWTACLLTNFACLESIFLRISGNTKESRISGACVTGIMFYLISSSLPAGILL